MECTRRCSRQAQVRMAVCHTWSGYREHEGGPRKYSQTLLPGNLCASHTTHLQNFLGIIIHRGLGETATELGFLVVSLEGRPSGSEGRNVAGPSSGASNAYLYTAV